MTTCQQACQFNPSCNFFTFSKDEEVCILHQVELEDRKCDLIHGPPLPSLQSCLNQMQIPWANSSGIEYLLMFRNVQKLVDHLINGLLKYTYFFVETQ